MDEGKLWPMIRNVLSQGGAIQLERASMSGYEEYSARLDAAASDRVADFAQLSDARIAELELECAQWLEELRIYRETENARIAELEANLSAACDIICDLGGEFREPDMIDAQIRAKDAKRYRWLRDQGGREVDTPWVVFRGGTWFLRSELDAAIDAARAGNGGGA